MSEIAFHIQRSAMWPVGLVTLAVLAVVWWTYRRTYPPLPAGYRLLLAAIRTLAVVLTGLLVFEPQLVVSGEQTRPERVAVLIDRSASMLLPQAAGDTTSRLAAAEAYLDGIGNNGSDISVYAFGRGITELDNPENLNTGDVDDQTDLAGALERLVADPGDSPDRLVVVSDGRINSGGDPLAVLPDSGLQVDAVLMGQVPPAGELSLTGIEQTAPAYEDADVELEVTVARGGTQQGAGPAMVDIFLDGRKVAERRMDISGEGAGMTAARLSFPAPEAGKYWLEAVLRGSGSRWSELDKHRLLRLDVRKSKRTFMLVSNSPDWDLRFVARALESNEDWRVETILVLGGLGGGARIRRSSAEGGFAPGQLPSRDELADVSLVLLHGRLGSFNRAFLDRVVQRTSSGEFAVIVWPAGAFDPRTLPRGLSSLLPFASGAGAIQPVDAPQTPSKLYTTGRYGVLNALGGGGVIEDLPPVNTVYRGLQLSRQAEILARAGNRAPLTGEGLPVLAVTPAGGVRTALVAAQGLWRWHMQRQTGSPEEAELYTRMWTELAGWLTSAGKKSPLTAGPQRDVLGRGEPLRMTGALTQGGDSETEVTVAVWAADSSGKVDTLDVRTAATTGNGEEFSLGFGSLPPGRYGYGAVAPAGSDTLTVSGSFAVESYSPEFAESSPDSTLLASLAARTGGSVVRAGGSGETALRVSTVTELVTSGASLARESWLYWLIVLLLAAEWTLRRRKALS